MKAVLSYPPQAKLDRWINARMLPYLPELTGNNWATVVNTGKPIVCAVIDSKQSAHKQYAIPPFVQCTVH